MTRRGAFASVEAWHLSRIDRDSNTQRHVDQQQADASSMDSNLRIGLLTKLLSAVLSLLALFFIRYVVSVFGFSYYMMEGGAFVWKSPAAYLLPPFDDLIWTAVTVLASAGLAVALFRKKTKAGAIFLIASALFLVVYLQIDQMSSVLLQNVVIFCTLVLARRSLLRDGGSLLATTMKYTLLILVAVEGISLLHYVSIAVGSPIPLLGRFASADQGIFYSFHVITPLLIILFLFSWLLKPYLTQYVKSVRALFGSRVISAEDPRGNGSHTTLLPRGLRGWHVLLISLCLGGALALIPYLPTLNPQSVLVGVDPVTRYYPHLTAIASSQDQLSAVLRIGHDRPLMYLSMWLLATSTSIDFTVRIMPLICIVSYVAATYMLAREMLGERSLVAAATFFAVFSFTTAVGIFSGLYSNWLALSLMLFSLVFLHRSQRSLAYFPILVVVYLSALAVHPWTWVVYTGALTVDIFLCGLLAARKPESRPKLKKEAGTIALLLASSLSIAAGVFMLWGAGTPGSLQANLTMYVSQAMSLFDGTGSTLFSHQWWETTFFSVYNYAGGGLINIPIFIVSLIGGLRMKLDNQIGRMLLSWLVVGSVLFIVPVQWLQYRVLYDVPVHLYAALGFTSLIQFVRQRSTPEQGGRHFTSVAFLLGALILLINLNYAVRFVTSLVP